MTDRVEILRLQARARTLGMVCNLAFDEDGHLSGVFFREKWLDPLTFAEMARREIWSRDARAYLTNARRRATFS